MVLSSSFPMLWWRYTRYPCCSLKVRKTPACRMSQLARLSLCSLRRLSGRGHMRRQLLRSRESRRPQKANATMTAHVVVCLRIHCFTGRVRCAGSATTSWLCSTRKSWIHSLSLSMGQCWRLLSRKSGIRWTTIRPMTNSHKLVRVLCCKI